MFVLDEWESQMSQSAKAIIQSMLETCGLTINGPKKADLQVKNERFYDRVLQEGSLGLGEAYMEGWWDCEALDELFAVVLHAKLDQMLSNEMRLKVGLEVIKGKLEGFLLNSQSKHRAFIVGEHHYDIGNDLYEAMLDKDTMSYTCGYWKGAKSLAQAQKNKLDLICRKLKLKPGMKLLDIGCGFGGMARFAAEHYGVSVYGVTVSKEQQRLGMERSKGLPVEIHLQDYRDIQGEFDAVVSIGMFEHVGPKNYETYMNVASRVLKNGGLFLLHTIGSNISLSKANAWIDKYIFPNGVLPSIAQIGKSIENHFVMEDWHNFGADYDKTLMAWHANFVKNYEQLKGRYNERFYRMWRYYLLSCAGAFRARDCQLWQVTLSKNGVAGGYQSIR